VAVLDAGGHLLAFQRQDGASTLRPQIAMAPKASAALWSRRLEARKIAEMAAERPSFIASLGPIAPHGMVPAAGGVIVIDTDGIAIGCGRRHGDTSAHDELCTFAGIAAAGLAPRLKAART